MANFFKEYQADIKAKKQAEENAKVKHVEYNRGQLVYINPMYDADRNSKRYFADYLSDGFILLAKTKKDAINGYGQIYSACIIRSK